MVNLDIAKATTTDLTNEVGEVDIDSARPDVPGVETEPVWDFPNAKRDLGLLRSSPELRTALRTHATWVAGKGIEVENARDEAILNRITGWGNDSFQEILINMEYEKKALGDSMASIVRNKKGDLINIKPLWIGDMRVVLNKNGTIKEYIERTTDTHFKPNQILHFCNDRFASEPHGTSDAGALLFVIQAKNEAMRDERKIRHRDLGLGVLYVDTEDTTKITAAITAYQKAVNETEVLVLPEGTAKIEDPKITPRDRIAWLQYLDNYFYRIVGVPKVLVEADAAEAASKVGFLSYDPIFTKDQVLMEQDIWNKLGIRIKLKRPPTLGGIQQEAQENEAKNTGQTGFQPNETQVSATRTE